MCASWMEVELLRSLVATNTRTSQDWNSGSIEAVHCTTTRCKFEDNSINFSKQGLYTLPKIRVANLK